MNLNDLGPSGMIFWIFCIRILSSLDYLFSGSQFYTPDYLKSDSWKMRKLLVIILVEITHLSMIHTFFKICDFQKVSVKSRSSSRAVSIMKDFITWVILLIQYWVDWFLIVEV